MLYFCVAVLRVQEFADVLLSVLAFVSVCVRFFIYLCPVHVFCLCLLAALVHKAEPFVRRILSGADTPQYSLSGFDVGSLGWVRMCARMHVSHFVGQWCT